MHESKVIYKPIGTIHSQFKDLEGMPIQPVGAKGTKGEIHLKEEFKEGLNRPNPIGMSVVRLENIEGSKINISNVDIVDGTPLLDIKPYIPPFDKCKGEKVRIGWLEDRHEDADHKKSDRRFISS
ncbi:MAG: TrmO family methyltransferase [Methanobacteriaceae archaeon]|jgi:tRNA (Thr-GGU) A37 N-methylase